MNGAECREVGKTGNINTPLPAQISSGGSGPCTKSPSKVSGCWALLALYGRFIVCHPLYFTGPSDVRETRVNRFGARESVADLPCRPLLAELPDGREQVTVILGNTKILLHHLKMLLRDGIAFSSWGQASNVRMRLQVDHRSGTWSQVQRRALYYQARRGYFCPRPARQ